MHDDIALSPKNRPSSSEDADLAAAEAQAKVPSSVSQGADTPPVADEVRSSDVSDVDDDAVQPVIWLDGANPSTGDDAPELPPGTSSSGTTDTRADVQPAATVASDGELEELTLPSFVALLEPLAVGTRVGPDEMLRVEALRQQRGRMNTYRALPVTDAAQPMEIELLEAPVDHSGLQRTADVLSEVHYPMLPTLHATWEHDGRRYVALEARASSTLNEALTEGLTTDEVISVVLQLAQALRRLHLAGWVLLGLTPDGVQVSQPVRITQLTTAVRSGESPSEALLVPGYSAPELVHLAPVSGKEDVYTLGALLYRGFSGTPLTDAGLDSTDLAAIVRIPGAPQLLAAALAPVDERIDLDAFYRGLLALKRRLAVKPIALRVASGTTIGLNQTRATNEDACGYLTWSSAYEGRVAYHAVLCAIDGMGGMEAGEVASTSALRAVLGGAASYSSQQISAAASSDLRVAQPDASGDTANGSQLAHLEPAALVQAAAEAAHTAAAGRQVGATITCAVIEDGRMVLGHVGDTRAYLLRDGTLVQITRDHSLVAAMVASGVLTNEEARGHPESNKVLRSLGGLKRLPPDYIDGLSVAYGEDALDLHDGDQLLLCSDGVWGVIDDNRLQQILTESPDLETVVAIVIREVLAGGAPDNAAIVVARCVVMPAA